MKYWILILSLVSGGWVQAQESAASKQAEIEYYSTLLEHEKGKMVELSERRSACELTMSNPDYLTRMHIEVIEVLASMTAAGGALGATTALTEHKTEDLIRRAKRGGFVGAIVGFIAGHLMNEMDRPESFRRELSLISEMDKVEMQKEYHEIMGLIEDSDAQINSLKEKIKDLK